MSAFVCHRDSLRYARLRFAREGPGEAYRGDLASSVLSLSTLARVIVPFNILRFIRLYRRPRAFDSFPTRLADLSTREIPLGGFACLSASLPISSRHCQVFSITARGGYLVRPESVTRITDLAV